MSTDDLPPLRDVIADFDLAAKKSLGQHFLLDLNVTRKIARLADLTDNDHVLEVGPGPGGLTRALLETGASVTAVERDSRAIEALQMVRDRYRDKFEIVEGDALGFDENVLIHRPLIIASNLPYNISTELLIKWIHANHTPGRERLWSRMVLMFQKEVADRILAGPGSKTYGRLSVLAQSMTHPSKGFDLPARAFTPPPKVDSSIVVFDALSDQRTDLQALERVTQAAFGQRRKMIRTSLKPVFGDGTEAILDQLSIPSVDRAEAISVEDYLRLAAAQTE
ncbi:MAG: 16S rRNA (adenine(1518)-N(6)/adenine(1519)-N(6))-dimethyltransferase RsmA [Pseudomonadota bacterium]